MYLEGQTEELCYRRVAVTEGGNEDINQLHYSGSIALSIFPEDKRLSKRIISNTIQVLLSARMMKLIQPTPDLIYLRRNITSGCISFIILALRRTWIVLEMSSRELLRTRDSSIILIDQQKHHHSE
jgi:hypothetical protein